MGGHMLRPLPQDHLILLVDLPEPEGLVAASLLVLNDIGQLVLLVALPEPEGLVATPPLLVLHEVVHVAHRPLQVVHADSHNRCGVCSCVHAWGASPWGQACATAPSLGSSRPLRCPSRA